MELLNYRHTSPLGELHIVYNNNRIYSLAFTHNREIAHTELRRRIAGVSIQPGAKPLFATDAIDRYFKGDLSALKKLPIRLKGCSLQERVWEALRTVASGETISYAQLAQRVGCSTSSHALAEALRSNLLQLVVPCHRVVSSHGAVLDYAAGLDTKVNLLKHERDSLALADLATAA